jgi:hypothetical protein
VLERSIPVAVMMSVWLSPSASETACRHAGQPQDDVAWAPSCVEKAPTMRVPNPRRDRSCGGPCPVSEMVSFRAFPTSERNLISQEGRRA